MAGSRIIFDFEGCLVVPDGAPVIPAFRGMISGSAKRLKNELFGLGTIISGVLGEMEIF